MRGSEIALALALGLAGVACGGDGRLTIHASFDLPAEARLSPADRWVRLRVTLDGEDRTDDVVKDLPPEAREVSFTGYPNSRRIHLTVGGYDENDNLVGYGEARGRVDNDNLELKVPLRRTLGYVTHRDVCDGGCAVGQACVSPARSSGGGGPFQCVEAMTTCAPGCGAGQSCVKGVTGPVCSTAWGNRSSRGPGLLYVIDIGSRSFVESIQIPGNHPHGLGVFARGGEGVWVVYRDDRESEGDSGTRAAFLSSSDHRWSAPLRFDFPHDLVVSSPLQRYAAAAGGGAVSLIDQQDNKVTRTIQVGGTVLDAIVGGDGGRTALFVTTAGLLQIDLDLPDTTQGTSPGDISHAAGIAVDGEGRIAYITSAASRVVDAIDLFVGTTAKLPGDSQPAFVRDVAAASYSASAQTLFAIEAGAKAQHLDAYSVFDSSHVPTEDLVGVLPVPSDIVAGPGGYQVLVISSGTSSATAGLTVIDAAYPPTGSTVSYFRDPNDFYIDSGLMFRERYQPRKLGVLYGQ